MIRKILGDRKKTNRRPSSRKIEISKRYIFPIAGEQAEDGTFKAVQDDCGVSLVL
jgi:hypothetical protein